MPPAKKYGMPTSQQAHRRARGRRAGAKRWRWDRNGRTHGRQRRFAPPPLAPRGAPPSPAAPLGFPAGTACTGLPAVPAGCRGAGLQAFWTALYCSTPAQTCQQISAHALPLGRQLRQQGTGCTWVEGKAPSESRPRGGPQAWRTQPRGRRGGCRETARRLRHGRYRMALVDDQRPTGGEWSRDLRWQHLLRSWVVGSQANYAFDMATMQPVPCELQGL